VLAWIESHQELANHPKTKRFRRALNIGTAQAIGHLHMLWWWALDYAQDGCIACADREDVAEACAWEGSPDELISALVQAGFIDAETERIHDWDEYGGRYLKRRDQARERQQKHRSKDGTYSKEGCHALVTRDMGVTHALVTPLQDRTGQERREENLSKPTVSLARSREPYPDDFEEFWKAYGPTNGPKKPAYTAWRNLSKANQAAAIAALPAWLGSVKWQTGYKDYPQKYLNQRFWENPPEAAHPANGRVPHQQTPEEIAEFQAWLKENQPA
jgi:hypothetical protein